MLPPEGARDSGALTAVLAPLPEEAEGVLRRLEESRTLMLPRPDSGTEGAETARRPVRVSLGRLAGQRIAVVVTGDGAGHARTAVRALLEHLPPSRLVAIGVAGALSPDLDPGDLVVGEAVAGGDEGLLRADADLVAVAAAATGAAPGWIVTAPELVDTPGHKADLLLRWRGDPALGAQIPVVVDLESAYYARAAREAGVPWLVIRSVSDTAAESLPVYLNGCRDTAGGVRRGAVLRAAMRRPGSLPVLLRLRRRVNRSAEQLADATEALLDALAAESVTVGAGGYG